MDMTRCIKQRENTNKGDKNFKWWAGLTKTSSGEQAWQKLDKILTKRNKRKRSTKRKVWCFTVKLIYDTSTTQAIQNRQRKLGRKKHGIEPHGDQAYRKDTGLQMGYVPEAERRLKVLITNVQPVTQMCIGFFSHIRSCKGKTCLPRRKMP